MVDHIRTLLLNPSGTEGYRKVADEAADRTLALIGLTGGDGDAAVVDALLPLVLAPDLAHFRRFYDQRTTPANAGSVYTSDDAVSLDGLYGRLFGQPGWFTTAKVFGAPKPEAFQDLHEMLKAALAADSSYALGAVLLACAYRRQLLQEGGV